MTAPDPTTVFDEAVGKFAAWQSAPWGRLWYAVAEHNLAPHLGRGPLQILDVGGGNGLQATELAKAGHHVTVLCHNLLHHVPDGPALLRRLTTLLRPDGILSLTALNALAEPLRLALHEADLPGALGALGQETAWTATFDKEVHQWTAERTEAILAELGCTTLGSYGIRVICDYLADDEQKSRPEFFADLVRLEKAMSAHPVYAAMGRFFHLVVRR